MEKTVTPLIPELETLIDIYYADNSTNIMDIFNRIFSKDNEIEIPEKVQIIDHFRAGGILERLQTYAHARKNIESIHSDKKAQVWQNIIDNIEETKYQIMELAEKN